MLSDNNRPTTGNQVEAPSPGSWPRVSARLGREGCQELRQALKVRARGGGENVAPGEVGDDRIPVTWHVVARQRSERSCQPS